MATKKTAPEEPASQSDETSVLMQYLARREVVSTYSDILKNADEKVLKQIENFTKNLETTIRINAVIYALLMALVSGILLYSFFFSLKEGIDNPERNISIGGALISTVLLVALVYRNPLKSSRNLVRDIVKSNVILVSYLRQIHQIDATFKQLYLSSKEFGVDNMQQIITQVKTTMEQTLEEVERILDEMDVFTG